jgi:hypothetical protein
MSHSGLNGIGDHGDNYVSPLGYADVRKIKGAEYSYLFDNNILFLVSYGEQVANHGDHGNQINDDNNDAFLTGITYTTAENYKIGLIYNYVDTESDDFYSLIVPIEKEYSMLTWNSSLVYANISDDDYIGLESAFTFPLGDMEHIKAIFNVDSDENDNTNYGYSLGYTKIYKMFFFEAAAGRVNTEAYSSNKATGSINLIF